MSPDASEREYECANCGAATTEFDDCGECGAAPHEFLCPHCDRTFDQQSYKMQHITKAHRGEQRD